MCYLSHHFARNMPEYTMGIVDELSNMAAKFLFFLRITYWEVGFLLQQQMQNPAQSELTSTTIPIIIWIVIAPSILSVPTKRIKYYWECTSISATVLCTTTMLVLCRNNTTMSQWNKCTLVNDNDGIVWIAQLYELLSCSGKRQDVYEWNGEGQIQIYHYPCHKKQFELIIWKYFRLWKHVRVNVK